MNTTGEIISFRVNFTKTQDVLESNMRLTFFGNSIPYSLKDEQQLFLKLQKNIENSKSGFNISDITEIVPNSEKFNSSLFLKFTIILCEKKESQNSDLKKRGILIGHSKDEGLFIIGAWPYIYFLKSGGFLQRIAKEFFANSLEYETYSHFLLVSQK